MRTIIRPAAVTRTETSDAGTTARGMKTSPHLWTRPSVRSAPPTAIVARPVLAHHSPISCPSCRNSSLIPGGIPSAHAQRVAALYNVEWTRRHMDEARVLLLYVFVEGAAYRTPDGMHVHGGPPRSSPDALEAALRSSFG